MPKRHKGEINNFMSAETSSKNIKNVSRIINAINEHSAPFWPCAYVGLTGTACSERAPSKLSVTLSFWRARHPQRRVAAALEPGRRRATQTSNSLYNTHCTQCVACNDNIKVIHLLEVKMGGIGASA